MEQITASKDKLIQKLTEETDSAIRNREILKALMVLMPIESIYEIDRILQKKLFIFHQNKKNQQNIQVIYRQQNCWKGSKA